MNNYIFGPNLGLLVSKAHKDSAFSHVFVTDTISEAIFLSGTTASNAMNMPLYIYGVDGKYSHEQEGLESRIGDTRRLNFDPKIYDAICTAASLTPSPAVSKADDFRTLTGDARPTEVKVFDYIYGILHSPAYRSTYAEFFRIDFPRIPYPHDPETFVRLSAVGEQLRRLHLLEPAVLGDAFFPFTGDGDDVVANGYPKIDGDRVLINAIQGFDLVPVVAWEFVIGGYKPAQKWLKDRRGRALSWEDVNHYQHILEALVKTDLIMREITISP